MKVNQSPVSYVGKTWALIDLAGEWVRETATGTVVTFDEPHVAHDFRRMLEQPEFRCIEYNEELRKNFIKLHGIGK